MEQILDAINKSHEVQENKLAIDLGIFRDDHKADKVKYNEDIIGGVLPAVVKLQGQVMKVELLDR